ncbi:hypothetical protein ASD65_15345 [Microbacterium sp. Root61]|nr:hypothetical protein ASD65_15345 [Microbacterium sp. Root61]
MRGQQQRDRALVLRHRWYAGGVATLISAALVFTGVSTPAMADTVPPPPDASAATPPPADTPPAETPPAETPPADTPPAVETPPADTTTPPAETPPSDTTTPPSDTTAPPADPTVPPADGSKTDSTESQIAPDEGLISPLSLAPACTNNCSNITFNAVINGGSATVADWTYRADRASSPDWYDFVPPQTIAVPRNATYAITATPNNATAQAYNTTVTCTDPGSGVTWNSPNLAFNNNSGLASTCTATHTFIAPQQATITVKVGSDRTGTTGVTNLAGVVLYLQSNTGGGAGAPSGTRADGVAGDAAGWARCVSDANGDCVFTVPDTQAGGANNGTQPWVVQHSVPAGYYANPTLRVGGATGDGSSLAYQFRMKVGISGTTAYSSLNANQLMLSSGTEGNASQGIWQQSRNNPTLQASCGLDVALILDLSGSVGDTTNLKQAANTFVNSLQGTPSRMSLFSFSWQTPASQAGPNVANLTSVATAAQGTAFKNLYANWDSDGGTNWDRGLGIAAESNTANNKFDVAVIITDGNPTTYNQPYQGSGSNNRFRETENGIYSANALKAAGTRVIAFGVGAGANGTNTALNLRSISGPTVYNGGNGAVADYYQTTDYAAVGTALRNLALGNCQGTLTVTKQIVPESAPPGSITGAVPAGAGWQFTSVMNTPGVTTPNPVRTTTADGTGTVTYPMTFPGGTLNGSVTVTEAQQPGFVLQPVNLQNAVCTNKTTNQPVIPSNVVDGFTVAVPSTDLVNCIVYNRAPSPESDVTVTKNWVVNGVPVANGAQPSGLSAQLHLTGPGNNTPTDQGWGVTRGGYTKGGNTTLTETVTLIDPAMCTNNAVITNLNGAATNIPLPGGGYVMTLPNEHNTATITNTVTCDSRLTLIKTVQGGNAAPTSWTLNASFLATPEVPAGVPGFSGATGAPGTTGQLVTPDARYQLFETGGSPLYAQTDNRTNLQSNPLSTGSATCIRVDANGAPWAGSGYSDGINGGVNVPLGYRVACTLVNQNAELTLLKNVVNDNGGSSPASAWSLTATPATLTGLSATSVAGSETVVPASMFEVRPRHVYTLTESNVAGYQFVKLQQFVGGVWVDVVANADPALYPQKNAQGNWQIQVAALDEAVYRFVNDDVAPKLTLVKTVTNDHGGTAQPGAWTLTATTPGGPNLSGTTGINGAVEAGEVYTIGENSGPSGYTWDTLSCTGYPNTTKAAPTLTLKPGDDVTCTLNNNDQPGQLTLVKVVDNANGGTAVAADWNGKLHAKRGSDATLNYNTSETKPVPAGTYTLTETGQLAGYDLTNLECSTGGTTLANNTVVVANGANVTCTFTNAAQKPTLTLEKQVVNTGGGTATADQWTLTATNGGNTPINGTGTPAGGSVASISGAVLGNTTYTLTESGPSGYNSTGIWACVVTGSQTVVPVTNNNQVKTAVGQNVTCRIVNTAIPATGTVAKSVLSTVQNADGTWTIRYRITVTNGSASSNYTYNLVDTLNYGGGLTPTSATVPVVPAGATANPAWTGLNPNTNLASNVSLTAVQHTHVWEIEVVSTVAASVPSGDTWKCEGGPTPGAGGFRSPTSPRWPARRRRIRMPRGTSRTRSR